MSLSNMRSMHFEPWKILLNTANTITMLGKLRKRQIQRVKEAADVLTNPQTTDRRTKYKLFLHSVLCEAGPGAVLLCAVTLGQVYITDMKDGQRNNFRNQIQATAIAPRINALAIGYGIPSSPEDIVALSGTTAIPQNKPPNEMRDLLTADILSDDSELPTAQKQQVFENAALHGITVVFNDFLYGAIRRVEGDSRAAVTMAFPRWGGLVDCLMSLDIYEHYVEQLAMALFGVKVKWVNQILHIVLCEGMTLIVPNSEATLKGVKDDTNIKVFGSEILDAITNSRVREREIAEGKHVTECVSMIFTKNGAIINLSLGLEGSLQLQNKLY